MLFFELLQVALGNRERLSRVPTAEEWEEIYEESGRQAVTGILLHGIDRLPAEQRPPQMFLLQWIGEGQIIEQQNRLLDECSCQLLRNLEEHGQKGTILKGQGIARLYNNLLETSGTSEQARANDYLDLNDNDNQELENSRIKLTTTDDTGNLAALRQPGDIDVYVDCGLKRALEFAKSIGQKDVEWDYKHLHLKVWDDTEVEMHYRVEVLLNLWKNRRLQKWFKKHENEVLSFNSNTNFTNDTNNKENTDKTDQTDGFVTPTVEFNVFYILLHIYRHFLYEGVGMRQIVDYYFVLKANTNYSNQTNNAQSRISELENNSRANTDGSDRTDFAIEAVREFGMEKFAKGLMWVMKEALGMPEEWMLWEPDQKEGRYILNQVMKGGNFGHYDEKLNHGGGKFGAVKAILTHNLHLLTHYPSDVIWAPIWIVWHKLWKIKTRMTL